MAETAVIRPRRHTEKMTEHARKWINAGNPALWRVYGFRLPILICRPFVALIVSSACQGLSLLITGGRSIPGTMDASYTFM